MLLTCKSVSFNWLGRRGAEVVGDASAEPAYRRMAEFMPFVKPVVPVFGFARIPCQSISFTPR